MKRELVNKLIKDTGVRLEHYREEFLEKQIKYRMKDLSLDSYGTYFDYIEEHPQEINEFVNKISINYSFFFRNPDAFEEMKELIKQGFLNKEEPIQIWSCPCASGEEPYTLAIILEDLRKRHPTFPDYHIVASDLNPKATKHANKGIYSDYIVNNVPKHYKNRYFEVLKGKNGPLYSINDRIKRKVQFIVEDIIQGHQFSRKYDVILCRNFLIYIEGRHRNSLLNLIKRHLKPGGYLFLGQTEDLPKDPIFKTINPRYHIYQKREEGKKKAKTKKDIIELTSKRKERISINRSNKSFEELTQLPEKGLNPNHQENENVVSSKTKEQLLPSKERIQSIEMEIPDQGNNMRINLSEELQKLKKLERKQKQEGKLMESKVKDLMQREMVLNLKEKELQDQFETIEKQLDRKMQLILEKEEQDILREQRINNKLTKIKELVKSIEERERLFKDILQKNVVDLKQLDAFVGEINEIKETFKNQQENSLKRAQDQIKERKRKLTITRHAKEKKVELSNQKQKERFLNRLDPNDHDERILLHANEYVLLDNEEARKQIKSIHVEPLESNIVVVLIEDGANLQAIANIELMKSLYHAYNSILECYLEIIKEGASEKNIRAILIGGMFYRTEKSSIDLKILTELKNKIMNLKIKIIKEDIGGFSGRSIYFMPEKTQVYVKKFWEEHYRIL